MEPSCLSFLKSLEVILGGIEVERDCKMEEYNDSENDAYNAYDAYDIIIGERQAFKEPQHQLRMLRHLEKVDKTDRNQLMKMKVFKPISRNAAKRLRIRQNAKDNKERQNCRSHSETNRNSGIPSQKEKNRSVKTDNNAKSCA